MAFADRPCPFVQDVQEIHDARTVMVEQQVDKNATRIVKYLKTGTAHREIELHPDVAEFLRRYMARKRGLLFHTRRKKPHLYGYLEASRIMEERKAR